MVSHPENGSDSPIGSDRDRGRDSSCTIFIYLYSCTVHFIYYLPVILFI